MELKLTHGGAVLDIEKLLVPFWTGNEVCNETVMLTAKNGQTPTARLFYKPEKILSVKSADLTTDYKEGVDWEYKNGELVKADNSEIPFINEEDCHFYEKKDDDCFDAKDGGYILFKTAGYFHKRQLAVTYTHSDSFDFDIRKPNPDKLGRVKRMLKNGESVKICFYGDSITEGCNGSTQLQLEPFMPGWPELFCKKLESVYGSKIERVNTAVGGKTSDWGAECANERIAAYKPDLAVVAFGMNDGTQHNPAETFKENIETIKNAVLRENSETEFVFISTMLANPECVFDGCQREYYPKLLECARDCDEVLNMTKLHAQLLSGKKYLDMTGNNINHPNDFLIRIYAQALLALFLG